MSLPTRLARLEGTIGAAVPMVTIVASDEADAQKKLERLMLGSGGRVSVTLEIAGLPSERFVINDKPQEYWVERLEATQ
jgi:hypothetical protein